MKQEQKDALSTAVRYVKWRTEAERKIDNDKPSMKRLNVNLVISKITKHISFFDFEKYEK